MCKKPPMEFYSDLPRDILMFRNTKGTSCLLKDKFVTVRGSGNLCVFIHVETLTLPYHTVLHYLMGLAHFHCWSWTRRREERARNKRMHWGEKRGRGPDPFLLLHFFFLFQNSRPPCPLLYTWMQSSVKKYPWIALNTFFCQDLTDQREMALKTDFYISPNTNRMLLLFSC